MTKFKVLRSHGKYRTGDTREANANDVAHLVRLGLLDEIKTKADPKVLNKAEPAVKNKGKSK